MEQPFCEPICFWRTVFFLGIPRAIGFFFLEGFDPGVPSSFFFFPAPCRLRGTHRQTPFRQGLQPQVRLLIRLPDLFVSFPVTEGVFFFNSSTSRVEHHSRPDKKSLF